MNLLEKFKEKWFELKKEPIIQLLFLPITIPITLAFIVVSFFSKGEPISEEELKKIAEEDENYEYKK
jgi:hypothetical protein